MGPGYVYTWRDDITKVMHSYYGEFDLMIEYRGGKYKLFTWFCDESGHSQGEYVIEDSISPYEILDKIKGLKV